MQCALQVKHGAESQSLDSQQTHSCMIQPEFTWLLCNAHEWCRTAVCILLCCCSLLCVSEALCGCWCLFGCVWTADVYWHTFIQHVYIYIDAHTKLITAPASLVVIISLNRNKLVPPGSGVFLSLYVLKVSFHTFTEPIISEFRKKKRDINMQKENKKSKNVLLHTISSV